MKNAGAVGCIIQSWLILCWGGPGLYINIKLPADTGQRYRHRGCSCVTVLTVLSNLCWKYLQHNNVQCKVVYSFHLFSFEPSVGPALVLLLPSLDTLSVSSERGEVLFLLEILEDMLGSLSLQNSVV